LGFEVGQRVADYEIVSLLGVGGMSRVYRVRNVISHRIEAMKVLLADLNAEPDLAARFASEIRTLAALDHPNIAQLHTALQIGNELVMMMEFVDGFTLQQLSKQEPLPVEKVVDYMHQVLAALSFAHNRGVVHRDIKPANIMVTPQGTAKLTDFGIAKSKREDELTRPGTTVGSLYYMSPEQAQGGRPIDRRSDIYSLGITMYELLAGRRPFEDESAYVILHSQLTAEPRPPIEVNPLISKPMSDLILKALEKDPAQRFQNAAAFSEALEQVTGIAAPAPIETSAIFAAGIAATPAGRTRPVPAPAEAETSRFLIPTQRGLWIAAEALVVLGVLVSSALGISHLFKTAPTAKTITHSTTQLPSSPTSPHDSVAAANTGQEAVTMPTPVATSTPQQVQLTVGSSNHPERPAGPKLSRVGYQPVSLPNSEPKAEEDAAPSVPASTPAELQEVSNQKAELDARAAAIRINVQRLKSEKEAAGGGLSQDVAGAYVRMNAYLGAEKTDLEDRDVAAARDHMEKAKSEVITLENLFNK
jgi:serine/threonine protein kinase